MRIIRLLFAMFALAGLATTTTLARESDGHRSSGSKTRSTKHSKSTRAKTSAKRKASAKASRSKRSGDKKLSTGDIDVSGRSWDLPPEELPASEADDADDSDDPGQ